MWSDHDIFEDSAEVILVTRTTNAVEQDADDNINEWMLAKRPSLTSHVKDSLEKYILAKRLKPGDQLPTESKLCQLFGVSRSAIREAVKILEFMGVVSVEPGRGTFLREFDAGSVLKNFPMALTLRNEDIEELTVVRHYLEDFAIRKAVAVLRNPNSPGLTLLRQCIEEMSCKAAAGEGIMEQDIQFHRHLASLAENRVLLMVLEAFWNLRRFYPLDNGQNATKLRYERHRDLLTALERGDTDAAIILNNEHYRIFDKEMQDG